MNGYALSSLLTCLVACACPLSGDAQPMVDYHLQFTGTPGEASRKEAVADIADLFLAENAFVQLEGNELFIRTDMPLDLSAISDRLKISGLTLIGMRRFNAAKDAEEAVPIDGSSTIGKVDRPKPDHHFPSRPLTNPLPE